MSNFTKREVYILNPATLQATKVQPEFDESYHASEEDIAKFTGVGFEPPRFHPGRLRKQLKRFRYKQAVNARRLAKGGNK